MNENFHTESAGYHSLGAVLSVRGSESHVGLKGSGTNDHERATVGSFLRIAAGPRKLIGMVTEVARNSAYEGYSAVATIDLMGELAVDAAGEAHFIRGVAKYPAIGDSVSLVASEELRVIYAAAGEGGATIGQLHEDDSIPVQCNVESLVSRHFAVLGSTGVGKSSGVAVILNEILRARSRLRVFLLDGHNEYGRCFGDRANVVNASNLKLPFWLFSFEELVDVLYGGRPGVEDEIDILAEHIPAAKGMYLQHRQAADRGSVRRADPRRAGFTVDTPSPYMIQDLIGLIDERMGRLENRATRMNYHRLLQRIDMLRSDVRYAFMFENANVGGDTMGEILAHLFRLEPRGQPMTVMQVAGLPVEVVDAVVRVVARLAFDFGLWSDGASPMLFVCEEAHRFAPADRTAGFGPTRRALMRIAKEGRKYGVSLGLVTQRPAELDPTIISQCNTLFAMRMANERDQALLRSAVTDGLANLLAFVPSLGTREVIGVGEGMPLPARLTFKTLAAEQVPHSEAFDQSELEMGEGGEIEFVKLVVDRWRNALGAGSSSPAPAEPVAAAAAPMAVNAPTFANAAPRSSGEFDNETAVRARDPGVANRLEQLRSQILKRGPGAAGFRS